MSFTKNFLTGLASLFDFSPVESHRPSDLKYIVPPNLVEDLVKKYSTSAESIDETIRADFDTVRNDLDKVISKELGIKKN